ncbi:MAG: hypothetical protein Q3998_06455 [Porphyromonas sp.]|nr:hypothetical protein [Porphyromonas sp.]
MEQKQRLPEMFCSRVCSPTDGFGQDRGLALIEAILHKPSPVSVRLHKSKGVALSSAEGVRSVPWCESTAFYLESRPIFTADPWWHSGAYYVQEAGSMMLNRYIGHIEPLSGVVVDLCAAPGGKSSLLRDTLPADTLLISNEWDASRVQILKENMTRLGHDNVIITHGDAPSLAASGIVADAVVIDAPCSGEGMFRKEPESVLQWSPQLIAHCAGLQKEIVDSGWEMLREGGVLIYSTCTYNREENEQMLSYILSAYDAEVLHPFHAHLEDGISTFGDGIYRALPSETDSEGFSIFAVRKCSGEHGENASGRLKKGGSMLRHPSTDVEKATSIPPEMLWEAPNGDIFALPQASSSVLQQLQSRGKTRIVQAGIPVAEFKGKDLIPLHPWSLSSRLPHSYPAVEVDAKQALDYLKRENISIDSPKGIVLLSYKGLPLGWVKQLGNRVNSLLPKGMTIFNKSLQPDAWKWSDFLKRVQQ